MDWAADLANFYADADLVTPQVGMGQPFYGWLNVSGDALLGGPAVCSHSLQYPATAILKHNQLVTIKGRAYRVTGAPLPAPESDGAELIAALVAQ